MDAISDSLIFVVVFGSWPSRIFDVRKPLGPRLLLALLLDWFIVMIPLALIVHAWLWLAVNMAAYLTVGVLLDQETPRLLISTGRRLAKLSEWCGIALGTVLLAGLFYSLWIIDAVDQLLSQAKGIEPTPADDHYLAGDMLIVILAMAGYFVLIARATGGWAWLLLAVPVAAHFWVGRQWFDEVADQDDSVYTGEI